jgi:hypothetical protein
MIAAEQSSRRVTSHVLSVAKFERFFRTAARLNVDKQDLKRHSDFINEKIYDLLIRAQAAAKANGRAIIEPFDLPITKGLQESVHEFKKIDGRIELQPILDQLTARPPLDLAYSDETESRLPEVVGAAADLMNEAHEAGNIAEVIPARRLQQLGCPVEIRRFDVLADDVANVAAREARSADTFVALRPNGTMDPERLVEAWAGGMFRFRNQLNQK